MDDNIIEENTRLKAELEAANKACAEKDHILRACDVYLAGASQPTNRALINHALSTDCGKGYLSPADLAALIGPTVELLKRYSPWLMDLRKLRNEASRLERELAERGGKWKEDK